MKHLLGGKKLTKVRQMGHSSIQVTVDIYGHLLETRESRRRRRRQIRRFLAAEYLFKFGHLEQSRQRGIFGPFLRRVQYQQVD
ncbi:hypothetical protein MYX65_03700 [Acidobacteria bacterium AH-259-L09]|nr:hypothetical protein [Acidobacteria bacterium AH-259-L09]